MKRCIAFGCVLLLCLAGGAEAKMMGLGLSAFYGINIPIAQDDAENGTVYGLRAPIQMVSSLRLEPWFSMAQNGDYTLPASYSTSPTFEGGEITSFGLNALLGSPMGGPGFKIAFVGGIGSHKYEQDGIESDSRIGYNVGLDMGMGLGSTPLGLSVRGEGVIIPLDGGGSRKNAFITGALTYNFGI